MTPPELLLLAALAGVWVAWAGGCRGWRLTLWGGLAAVALALLVTEYVRCWVLRF